MKRVLGSDKYLETARPAHDLYGRFTSMRDGRFLVVINEANGSDNFAANDTIKDMITGSEFSSEGKGSNAFTLQCYARFLFTTNNDNCLKINPDSRRYVVFEASSASKGDTEYFKRLSAHIDDDHTIHEFYAFLMARDLSKRDWINDRPITQFYMDMVEQSMPFEHAFVKDMVLQHRASGSAVYREGCDALLAEFRLWLDLNGPKQRPYETNLKKFGLRMSKLTSDHVSSGGFASIQKSRRAQGMVYAFDINELYVEMQAKRWISPDQAHAFRDDGEASS
jgi:hypothetical protein